MDTCDVAIVGGGVIGAAVAFALAERGQRVVLLEATRVVAAASGNSFAWINGTAKVRNADYHRLNARGVECYYALAARFGAATIGLHGAGELQWSDPADAESLAALEWRATRLTTLGYPVRRVDAAEMAVLEPAVRFAEGAHGLLAPRDRWLDVPRFVAFMVDQIRAAGGTVREACRVTGLAVDDRGRVTGVATDHGALAAAATVLAAGVATPDLVAGSLGADVATTVPVDAVPSVLVDLPAADLLAGHVLHAPGPSGLDVRQAPGGGTLLCADPTEALSDKADEPARRRVADALIARALPFLPQLDKAALRARVTLRIGVRPIPADGLSIVGPLPGIDGLHVIVTHSGVTLAPLVADLVADSLCDGAQPPELIPYAPARFLA